MSCRNMLCAAWGQVLIMPITITYHIPTSSNCVNSRSRPIPQQNILWFCPIYRTRVINIIIVSNSRYLQFTITLSHSFRSMNELESIQSPHPRGFPEDTVPIPAVSRRNRLRNYSGFLVSPLPCSFILSYFGPCPHSDPSCPVPKLLD